MNLTYVILPTEDLTQSKVDVCQNTSLASVRRSLDGTMVVLKFDSSDPPPWSAEYPQYTHAEILAETRTPDWSDPE